MINIPKDLSDIEVGLYKSGYEYCEKLVKEENIAIAEAVENTADRFSGLKMIADIECFKKFLFSEVTAYTEPSIGVRDPNLEDKTWWDELKKKPKFKSEYWSRYYDYLLKKPSWSITAVKNIDSSTDEIMNALTNPRKGTAGERMGMVFGYVQSGKTAHYIGMINKAYDAGYRIVIVLSGIHNSLRSQTQSRIDEEVLGQVKEGSQMALFSFISLSMRLPFSCSRTSLYAALHNLPAIWCKSGVVVGVVDFRPKCPVYRSDLQRNGLWLPWWLPRKSPSWC